MASLSLIGAELMVEYVKQHFFYFVVTALKLIKNPRHLEGLSQEVLACVETVPVLCLYCCLSCHLQRWRKRLSIKSIYNRSSEGNFMLYPFPFISSEDLCEVFSNKFDFWE